MYVKCWTFTNLTATASSELYKTLTVANKCSMTPFLGMESDV